MVGNHLKANPPGDSNVDDVKAAFAAVVIKSDGPTPGTKETRARLEWRRSNES